MPTPPVNYYEILGFTSTDDRNAITETSLKRRYYSLALRYHPDKNPNNPETTEQFQLVNEAYQVLSNPARRKRYDEYGVADMGDVEDAAMFFKRCFGGVAFEDVVGDFFISSVIEDMARFSASASASAGDVESGEFMDEERVAQYKDAFEVRVVKLAAKLLEKIGDFKSSDVWSEEKFRSEIGRECERLEKEPNAKRLLASVGYVYYVKSKQAIGKYKFLGIPSYWTGLKDTGHLASQSIGLMNSYRKLAKQADKILPSKAISTDNNATTNQDKVENSYQNGSTSLELDAQTEQYLMQFIGNITCLDVEFALRKVMESVLGCTECVGQEEIIRRAKAIKIIGKMYIETSKKLPADDVLTIKE